MLRPLDESNLREYLTALADGELDAPQSAAVWAYLADHPDAGALRWLADQQRLTLAARAALAVAAPQALRDRIAAMATAETPAVLTAVSKAAPRRAWPRQVGYALAMAAVVAVAVTAGRFASRPAPPAGVVPSDLIVTAGRIHAACSRLPEASHDARLEDVDPRLADLTRADVGNKAGPAAVSAPDLSTVGFRLVGAGPCPASKAKMVHLLYRSTRPPGLAAVSLFLQVDAGQWPALQAGHVYRVSSPTSPFPMLAWRSGAVIYFLLADDDSTETGALHAVRPTAATAIINTVLP